jgi:hypothetical protein
VFGGAQLYCMFGLPPCILTLVCVGLLLLTAAALPRWSGVDALTGVQTASVVGVTYC